MTKLTNEHYEMLENAVLLLENPGIAAKVTNLLGKPIEKGLEYLPESAMTKISEVTKIALEKALKGAITTMNKDAKSEPSNKWHKFGVAATGAVGGAFGLPALAIELPVSTTIMLRSIADIARSKGENLNSIATQLACLEVFALGGESKSDDGTESGYFIVRAALAKSITDAAKYILEKGLVEEGAPIILKFILNIAQRFSIQVSEKVAAQSIPAIGAIGGATINTLFIDHFQDMAEGHFTVRQLEKIYGTDTIKEIYDKIRISQKVK